MSVSEVQAVYGLPLPELVRRASSIHAQFHASCEIEACELLSIKTGGCPEDCAYCPQSVHNSTGLRASSLLPVDYVRQRAIEARERGVTRFCLGAAWRSAPSRGGQFEKVLRMVECVSALGLEACCTLGMLTSDQARRLAEAGLYAYNHNLDTSREYYGEIISTRTYDERLATLAHARGAGLKLCVGGIIGMGETRLDRCSLLWQLARMDPHPESVPINMLARVPGTPLERLPACDPLELVRTVATARILMPSARLRLSAGRAELTDEAHALLFLAGANSIFLGDRLLTTGNRSTEDDRELLLKLGLNFRKAAHTSSEKISARPHR